MITELTHLRETRAGVDLFDEALETGIEQRLAQTVKTMAAKGLSAVEIADLTDTPLEKVESVLAEEKGE